MTFYKPHSINEIQQEDIHLQVDQANKNKDYKMIYVNKLQEELLNVQDDINSNDITRLRVKLDYLNKQHHYQVKAMQKKMNKQVGLLIQRLI